MCQVLEEVGGDVDAAVEYLIAAQGSEENLDADGVAPTSDTVLMVMAGQYFIHILPNSIWCSFKKSKYSRLMYHT